MDAIIDRYTGMVRDRSLGVTQRADLSPHQQILAVILAAREQPESQTELLEQLHLPENEIFHQRSQQRTYETMVPILTGIVEDGISLSIFSTRYPQEAIEMILLYAGTAFDAAANVSPEIQAQRVAAFIHHCELLLGAEPGSFAFLAELLSSEEQAGGTRQ